MKHTGWKILYAPISALALYILTLCLVANISYTFQRFYLTDFLKIVAITCLEAYAISATIKAFKRIRLGRIFSIAIIALLNACILAEYFCIFKFSRIINQDIIDIVAETNYNEITEFLNTYLNTWTIIAIVSILTGLNIAVYKLSKEIFRIKITKPIFLTLAILGGAVFATSAVGYIRYRNGNSMPQYTSLTRMAYSYYISQKQIKEIEEAAYIYDSVDAVKSPDDTAIILVIGESFSKFHCSAYGYSKKTTPNLERRISNKEMVKFSNVVTIDDHTAGVMTALFRMDSKSSRGPLFPMLFKKAGYSVHLLDNQYFTGGGISILSSKKLSDIMFDKRNSHGYAPEGEIVEDINVEKMTLTIVHLMGQHYTYSARYPHDKFTVFTADDYPDSIPQNHREVMAHYDNATIYNDYIIESIIRKAEDKDAILIYLPDHGEEVYDYRNYSGHGNAASSTDIDYQISIPMFVWMSDKYKQSHQSEAGRIHDSENKPISSDDISHFLVDLAGIRSSYLSPSRSFINSGYDENKHRIVLHSIDYDAHL